MMQLQEHIQLGLEPFLRLKTLFNLSVLVAVHSEDE